MRKAILKIYAGIAIAVVAYLLFYLITGHGIPCFYYSRYGYQCPGCGLSRMLFSLVRLDIPTAFQYNPVGFTALFLWNAVAALCFWGKPAFLQKPRTAYILLGVTVGAFLIQGFLRNVS